MKKISITAMLFFALTSVNAQTNTTKTEPSTKSKKTATTSTKKVKVTVAETPAPTRAGDPTSPTAIEEKKIPVGSSTVTPH